MDAAAKTEEATELWKRMVGFRNEQQYPEAAELAARFIFDWPDDPRRQAAEVSRLWCLSRLGRWT